MPMVLDPRVKKFQQHKANKRNLAIAKKRRADAQAAQKAKLDALRESVRATIMARGDEPRESVVEQIVQAHLREAAHTVRLGNNRQIAVQRV